MDSTIKRIEEGQKAQGMRIGSTERSINIIEHNEREISKLIQRVEAIEKEPAAKWKGLVAQIITLVVGAVFALVIALIMRGEL